MNTNTQFQTVFGGEFVQEQHLDGARRYLSGADVEDAVNVLSASFFEEILKSLRSTLGLGTVSTKG